MQIANPCIDCGTPTRSGVRCEACTAKHNKIPAARTRPYAPQSKSPRERGYDSRWARLSRRARQAQPFCSDCGATDDLQCDHTPEAWERKEKGLPIRLEDVDVVCGPCNRRRGAARGKHVKRPFKAPNSPHGNRTTRNA